MRFADAPKASPNGAGVYVITNTINHKRYVGSTHDFNERWNNHVSRMTYLKHINKHLERAWHKYGGPNFTFTVVEYTICLLYTSDAARQSTLCRSRWSPYH